MVRREFLTKKVQDSHERLGRAMAELLEVGKTLKGVAEYKETLGRILPELDDYRAKIKSSLETEFDKWRASTNATILHFNPSSLTAVIDDYFNGSGAYREQRSRDDIPDAIIASCICSLSEKKDGIYVILKDSVLRNHLNSIAGIRTITSLKEFFEISEVKKLLQDAEARSRSASVAELKAFFSSTGFRDDLEQHVFGSNAILGYVYIGPEAIDGTDSLALAGWGFSINEPESEDVHDVRLGDVTFIEEGQFAIGVEFTTWCRIDYCASYTDYMKLLETDRAKIGERSVSRDGVADLCEQHEVRLHGFIDLVFPPDSTVSEVIDQSRSFGDRNPKIRADLNVERGTIF
jgi:hypothetical protein